MKLTRLASGTWFYFLEPTVDFVQDGTRSEIVNNDRQKYSLQIKQLLKENGIGYYCIGGDYLNRFNKAKMLIKSSFRYRYKNGNYYFERFAVNDL